MLTVGSLFAGIGGFDLGFERAGMRTLWFCEQDEFCQRVLARHWPGVPCYPDVRALVADTDATGLGRVAERNGAAIHGPGLREGHDPDGRADPRREPAATGESADAGLAGGVPVPVPYVDVLCGGFPCQDLSFAGRGAGLAGERSGLWREFARLIGELRPRYVVVENVPALASRGLDRVLADLAACGFDAEWDHLPASAFGAPHRRDRIWLVAYHGGERAHGDGGRQAVMAHTESERWESRPWTRNQVGAGQLAKVEPQGCTAIPPAGIRGGDDRFAQPGMGYGPDGVPKGMGGPTDAWGDGWEDGIPRVAVGIRERTDKLRALGNALVPQIAEWIGRRIVEWERVNA